MELRDVYMFSFLSKSYAYFTTSGYLCEIDKATEKILKSNKINPICSQNINFKSDKLEKINSLSINVSQTCNMTCDYCYANQGTYGEDSKIMDINTAFGVLNYLICKNFFSKNVEIIFFGGEPLINFELIKNIISYLKSLNLVTKFIFRLSTNGTLLSNEIIQFICDNNIKTSISLDGSKDDHDKRRRFKNNSGTFDIVSENIKKIINKRPDLVLIKSVFEEDSNLISRYKFINRLGVKAVDFKEPISLNSSQKYLKVFRKLINFVLKNKAFYKTKLNGMEKLAQRIQNRDISNFPCGAGRNYLAVDALGNFYPCHRFIGKPEFQLGNFTNGLDISSQRIYSDYNSDKKESCSACWARFLCAGGCYYENYMTHGDMLKVGNELCEGNKEYIKLAFNLVIEKLI
jgi:uncharacterized protein